MVPLEYFEWGSCFHLEDKVTMTMNGEDNESVRKATQVDRTFMVHRWVQFLFRKRYYKKASHWKFQPLRKFPKYIASSRHWLTMCMMTGNVDWWRQTLNHHLVTAFQNWDADLQMLPTQRHKTQVQSLHPSHCHPFETLPPHPKSSLQQPITFYKRKCKLASLSQFILLKLQ